MAHLILITGVPATGKTSLASALNKKIGYPVISKDGVKETLYDALGCDSRQRSRELGKASMNVVFNVLERLLSTNVSCITEANFRPEFDNQRLHKTLHKTGAKLIQILCKGDPEVIFKRFCERALSGDRHKGHCDPENLEEFRAVITQGLSPLNTQGGVTLTFDTTVLSDDILNKIVDNVLKQIAK